MKFAAGRCARASSRPRSAPALRDENCRRSISSSSSHRATRVRQPASARSASLSKRLAPILVAKCSKCHIDKSAGEFSMATYGQLAKGSKDGVVHFPARSDASRMTELIEQEMMPQQGRAVRRLEELALLIRWIDKRRQVRRQGMQPIRLSGMLGRTRRAQDRDPASSRPPARKTCCLRPRTFGRCSLADCTGCHGCSKIQRARPPGHGYVHSLAGGRRKRRGHHSRQRCRELRLTKKAAAGAATADADGQVGSVRRRDRQDREVGSSRRATRRSRSGPAARARWWRSCTPRRRRTRS